MQIREGEPLARYTSWRIGGLARYFAPATDAEQLRELVAWAVERQTPFFVLGGGTNILVSDAGYDGLVIRNRARSHRVEERLGEATLYIESGAPTAGTVRRLAGQGIGGLQWAEGLPGTFGGAVFGNAGCYGGDMAHHLVRAWILRNGEVEVWPLERLAYGYRTSALKRAQQQATVTQGSGSATTMPAAIDEQAAQVSDLSLFANDLHPPIVLAAELGGLYRDDPARLDAQMAEIAAARRSKTPAGSSCGSVFKNPPGTTSGTLLDQAGLKGTRVGSAVVSEKHANYIVNLGGATASDILRLTEIMRERVLAQFGIELDLEVQLVGTME